MNKKLYSVILPFKKDGVNYISPIPLCNSTALRQLHESFLQDGKVSKEWVIRHPIMCIVPCKANPAQVADGIVRDIFVFKRTLALFINEDKIPNCEYTIREQTIVESAMENPLMFYSSIFTLGRKLNNEELMQLKEVFGNNFKQGILKEVFKQEDHSTIASALNKVTSMRNIPAQRAIIEDFKSLARFYGSTDTIVGSQSRKRLVSFLYGRINNEQ